MKNKATPVPDSGSPVSYALIQKRADIAGEIEAKEVELRRLLNVLDHIDFTIHLFDPNYEIAAIRNTPKLRYNFRGESSTVVLDTLRMAKEPVSTEEIGVKLIEARRLDPGDLGLRRLFRYRTNSIMQYLAAKGLVRRAKRVHRMLFWELAPFDG